MTANRFLLSSPIEMLDKAKRELKAMEAELSADSIFNCFVTAYHVMDYVKALGTISQPAIDAMYADGNFDLCRFICNRGKHLNVTRDPKNVAIREDGGSGFFGFGPIGGGPMCSLPEWRFYCDDEEVRPIELAEKVIKRWELFFATNGIT